MSPVLGQALEGSNHMRLCVNWLGTEGGHVVLLLSVFVPTHPGFLYTAVGLRGHVELIINTSYVELMITRGGGNV